MTRRERIARLARSRGDRAAELIVMADRPWLPEPDRLLDRPRRGYGVWGARVVWA